MSARLAEKLAVSTVLEHVTTVRAALDLWLLSLSDDDAVLRDDVCTLQVSLRAIVERLAVAETDYQDMPAIEAVEQDRLMLARHLLAMVERALWNLCSVTPDSFPEHWSRQVRATVAMVQQELNAVEMAHAQLESGGGATRARALEGAKA